MTTCSPKDPTGAAAALRERLSRLSKASLRINESLDLDTVLQGVLDSARALASARYGVVEVDGRSRRRAVRRSDGDILYVTGVSDGGIGIPNSLRRNHLYSNITSDKDAILRATEMDVTGTDQQRGAACTM